MGYIGLFELYSYNKGIGNFFYQIKTQGCNMSILIDFMKEFVNVVEEDSTTITLTNDHGSNEEADAFSDKVDKALSGLDFETELLEGDPDEDCWIVSNVVIQKGDFDLELIKSKLMDLEG